MRVFSEGDGNEYTAWFKATPGVPTVPTTVHWRVRDQTSDTILQDWTEVFPEVVSDETGITGVRAVINVPGSINVLVDRSHRREVRELQVVADKDMDRQYSAQPVWEYAIAYGGQR